MDAKIAAEAIRGLKEAKQKVDHEIDSLIAKKAGYEVSIEYFRTYLKRDNDEDSPGNERLHEDARHRPNTTNVASSDELNEEEFPKTDRRKQIVYTLKEIGRFVKLKYLGDEVKDYLNAHSLKSETFLRAPVNVMIEEGSLVTVRYNGNWKKVFYGLPEWIGVNEHGDKFILSEFAPAIEDVGYSYGHVEFDYEPRKFNRDKQGGDEDEEDEEDDLDA